MQSLRRFLITLGALTLVWQVVSYQNDDLSQAAGLYSLADGHYWVSREHLPEGYQSAIDSGFNPWGIPQEHGIRGAPVGSTPLNLLALPVLLVFRLAAAVVGPGAAVAITAGATLGLGINAARRQILEGPGTLPFALASVNWLLAGPASAPPASPFLELAALSFVSLAAMAATVHLVGKLAVWFIHDRSTDLAGHSSTYWVAAGLTATTPALFWASSAKYHALATFAAALAFWLYRDGHRSAPKKTFLAGLTVGFAIWNFLPMGGLLALVVVALAIPVVTLGKQAWPRIGAGIACFTVGISPFLAQRMVQARLRIDDQFLPHFGPGAWQRATAQGPVGADQGWLAHTVFQDPSGVWLAFQQWFVWPTWDVVGPMLSAPMLVPGVVAVVAAALGIRIHGARLATPLRAWILLVPAVTLALMGGIQVHPGGVHDPRYLAWWWPMVAVGMAWIFHHALAARTVPARLGQHLALAMALGALVLPALVVAHAAGLHLMPQGTGFEHTVLHRFLAPVLALGLLITAWRLPAASVFPLAWAAGAGLFIQLLLRWTVRLDELGGGRFGLAPLDWWATLLRWVVF